MANTVLVVNAGSSTLKFQSYDVSGDGTVLSRDGGQISGSGDLANAELLEWVTTNMHRPPSAIGHRIVHGGPDFFDSSVVTNEVLNRLEALAPLAPLHQRNNLLAVHAFLTHWPDVPQVACFDTAFHRGHSKVIERFALPHWCYDQGVRRYGFHGLSYEYIAQYLDEHLPQVASGRVIAAHLGSGASACALLEGVSVESTMGFTALDGLPMSTRPGRLDPGVVLWLVKQGASHDEIQDLLYNQSGLKGLSGISGDVRVLLGSTAPMAKLALSYFAYRAAESMAGLCVSMGGIDSIVFTAGVGENSPAIRRAICKHLEWLGVELDDSLNAQSVRCVSGPHSRVGVYVVQTDEASLILSKTCALLFGG